jgi:hypothetical protein
MERLDQGHLYPLLEVPRLTCPGTEIDPGPPRWQANTLAKSHSNSVLIAIQNIYMILQQHYHVYKVTQCTHPTQYLLYPSASTSC